MHTVEARLLFSATDLSNFLACPHLSLLDRQVAFGAPRPRVYEDPALEALRRRGLEHERAYLEARRAAGAGHVVEIASGAPDQPRHLRWAALADQTHAAMEAGADVVYQSALFDGTWIGRPDFLTRVETPSLFGEWSYEVVDAKLAREAKGGALLQLLLYADLLAAVQGRPPESVHLALGGPDAWTERFRVADYAAYFRAVRRRFLQHLSPAAEPAVAPEPAAHCHICAWRQRCDAERREVDHLSLVAGITRGQRRGLAERGVSTVGDLASLSLPLEPPLPGVGPASLARVPEQARVQVEGRRRGAPYHELLQPVTPGQGLAALPAPSPGDLFLDLEGDPFALVHGIEYLFGWADSDGRYVGRWALDRAGEKQAFEDFIDLVRARLAAHPDLHIYHFAAYEPSAFKRLMGRYGTREEQLDRLLRGEVFVDLHRVVRQALRASVESYSIKKLEPFYGFTRDVDLRAASGALAHFEAFLELGPGETDERALRDIVEGYNRDDCLSTRALRDWLERLRDDAARLTGAPVPRPEAKDPEPSEAVSEQQQVVEALVARLTADVPLDEEARTPEQQARWLLAQLLGFHGREKKATWWEYFRCLALSDEELIEDRATLGGLEYVGVVGAVKKSLVHRYRFPHQEHGISVGDTPRDPATESAAGTVVAIDDAAGTIDLRRGKASTVPHPRALVPLDDVADEVMRQSLQRLADNVASHGLGDSDGDRSGQGAGDAARGSGRARPYRCTLDLLLRRAPRVGQAPGASLMGEGETTLDAAVRLAPLLRGTVLPIQGPPGSGKTFTAARMILELLAAGKRVGVTATSHKVIGSLLDEVCRAADQRGVRVPGIQKAEEEEACADPRIEVVQDNPAVRSALDTGRARLAAGTAWLWSRDDMAGAVDVLFVDEAGQFSLANALAIAPATDSLVLVGDPRQLDQPQQGVHPPGCDVSALEHLLGGRATVAPEAGLFLAHTWRLHPRICAFTSELFYEGRLEPLAGLERQCVRGSGRLTGSGLRLVPVEHAGNQNESPEEVEAVATLVADVLRGGSTWVDRDGREQPLELADILVVAPYNAQVSALAERLPAGARVGTVDKFQGQQAPIVIYSMASSSAEDAPRGMGFLYSPNRLNVATSRARCLAVVVASPAVFAPECRTPEQMRLANAFCRFVELAE